MLKHKNIITLTIASLCYVLGFPNIFTLLIPFLPIVGVTLLMKVLLEARSTKKRLLFYFYYNGLINLMGFYWITGTLQEFGQLPFIVAALMNGAFTFIFNPQYVVFIFLLHAIDHYFPKLKPHLFNSGLSSFTLAMTMSLLDYYMPQQFPTMLGQPWIVLSEYLGAAAYFGLPIFSFMSYLVVFESLNKITNNKLSSINLCSILLFIIINPFLVPAPVTNKKLSYNVRLVQANISNFLKVDSESGTYASVAEVLGRYEDLSVKKPDGQRPLDLIVWPETAYPYALHTANKDRANLSIPPVFQTIIDKTKTPILFGGYDHFRDSPDNSFYQTDYNAAFYLNQKKQVTEIYHKQILIPFGETLPLGPLNKWASSKLRGMAFFAEGDKFPLFHGHKGVTFITSICYEILRPEFFRSYLNSLSSFPHFMINLTNDSWYGNTVEPEQHLFLARWRAIEFNLPILRSTNTGISTFIMANGLEANRLDYDVTGNLDLEIKLPSLTDKKNQTIFQRYGLLAILPLWVLYFIFHLILIRLKYD